MGFLSALSAATQYIATGAYKRVLVCGTEVLSRILNWEDRGTCVLFGDGAGAVVLEAAEFGGSLGFVLHSDGSKKLALFAEGPCGPRDAEGNGAPPHLCMINMDGPAMFKLAVQSMSRAVREATGESRNDTRRHRRAGAAPGEPADHPGRRRSRWACRWRRRW